MRKTVRRKIRRGISCVVGVVTVVMTTGCELWNNGKDPVLSPEGYEIWSAPATEKILQDSDAYEAFKGNAKVEVDAARNEHENAQLVLTAGGSIDEYDVELSNLKLKGGDAIYDKSNVTLYNMKYVHVTSPWTPGAALGWYPDAILPFEAAAEAGENSVKAGDNQSIWISFEIPADQEVGTYEGSLTLTVDGEKNVVPVTLRVRNVTVTDVVHNKAMFINSWSYYLGEYGDTQEMVDAYNKLLFEYRVAPTALVIDKNMTPEYFEYYAEKAYEIAGHDGASTIALPCTKSNGIPNGMLTSYIRELAKKSLETGYNLVKKAYVYGIDEPISNNALDRTKAFAVSFRENIANIVAELTEQREELIATYGVTEEYFDEVFEAAANVRYVTTTSYREDYEPYVDIWCPHFNSFESGYATGLYDGEDKMWWYGAVSPKAPYPTYHLDDTLLSSRMIGWLQSIYNVEGNIYWAVNVYAKYNGSYQYVDEYYTDPGHYYNVNGDGFLFYPGKKYGIDGPIPSIRLESIRDGYEEYELLYAIDEKYAEIGEKIGMDFSSTETVADIASSLYTGMKITATNDSFAQARSKLLDLSEFTESGICFIDYTDNGEGVIEYELYVPDTATLTVTGAELCSQSAVAGGKIVKYRADMKEDGAARAVRFETKVGEETVAVERDLTGKVSLYDASWFVNGLGEGVIAQDSILIDGVAMTGSAGQLLRLAFPDAAELQKQEAKLFNADFLSKVGAQADKLVFNFWYDGEASEYPVEVYIKYKKQRYEQNIASSAFLLKHGWNSIEWKNLGAINWTKNGEVEYIVLSVGNLGDKANATLYLKNVAIYEAKGG